MAISVVTADLPGQANRKRAGWVNYSWWLEHGCAMGVGSGVGWRPGAHSLPVRSGGIKRTMGDRLNRE